jgi:putative ABC transport system permease protein
MISSYFKYAFRNLLKHRGQTFINLFGLSFSIACVIIIFLYSSWELSYNDFHQNNDRIYRMYSTVSKLDGEDFYSPYQPSEMAAALEENIPGIEHTCRMKATQAWIGIGDVLFQEDVGFVDSTFFDIFSYDIIAGDKVDPLSILKSVVLTESVARKIFGDSLISFNEIIGEIIEFPEKAPFNLYEVTAVIADPPKNSSFKWTVLIPYVNSKPYPRSNDFTGDTYVYVMLDETNDLERLEKASQDLVEEIHGKVLEELNQLGYISSEDNNFRYHFMKYKDFYLGPNKFSDSYEKIGSRKAIFILSSIAILILLIACFNYVMISIGASLNRIGDFGIMNIMGARRWQILLQFVIESFVLTLISLFLGIILAEQLLPLFNRMSQVDIHFSLYREGRNFVFLALILLFIVLSTSSYIGLYLLRKCQPLQFLRKEILSVRRNGVASLSVVIQFFIAIVLLISGGVIIKQLNYMMKTDVGFNKENVLVIPVDFSREKVLTLKGKLLESPHVKSVSMSDRSFISGSSSQGLKNKKGELTEVRFLRVDADYIETLGLQLIEGRNFFKDEPIDSNSNVVINEALVRNLGLEDPIGDYIELNSGDTRLEIIGVVKDFHFDSMHDEVQGLMMHVFPYNSIWYMFVKADEDVTAVLNHSEKVWKEVVPEFSWDYSFMTDTLESQYKNEDRWSRIVAYASVIAILLSCLGLMGISGLLVARRFKEVGIRKANGATILQIIVLLNMQLLKWVMVAFLIACPAAWFIMHRWLEDFAFRTQLSWWIFVLAGLAAIIISLFTITYQIYRVAIQNPVNALKYE